MRTRRILLHLKYFRKYRTRAIMREGRAGKCSPMESSIRGNSLNQDLYGFAVELRQLAYTMPGGHEDPLIRLSERIWRDTRGNSQQPKPGSPPRQFAT